MGSPTSARSIPAPIGRLKTRAVPGRTWRGRWPRRFPVAALSYTRVHQWRLDPVPTAGAPGSRQEGGRVPTARSLLTQHFGVSLAQSLGDAVVVGVTARLVRGGVSSAEAGQRPDRRRVRRARPTPTGRRPRAATWTLGVLVRLARVRVGLAARNLAAPTFTGADGVSWTLDRRVRAGVAMVADADRAGRQAWVVAVDADLTRDDQVAGTWRGIGAGVERWIAGAPRGVRGGVEASTAGAARAGGDRRGQRGRAGRILSRRGGCRRRPTAPRLGPVGPCDVLIMPVRIGELLLKEKRITPEQLEEVLTYQKTHGGKLGLNLVKLGFVKDEDITALLSKQYGVPSINLTQFEIDPGVIKLIPGETCHKYQIIPLSRSGATLTIAMTDPTNVFAMDDIKFMTGYNVEPVVASEGAVVDALEKYYPPRRPRRWTPAPARSTWRPGRSRRCPTSAMRATSRCWPSSRRSAPRRCSGRARTRRSSSWSTSS